jgi:hypothetical protein
MSDLRGTRQAYTASAEHDIHGKVHLRLLTKDGTPLAVLVLDIDSALTYSDMISDACEDYLAGRLDLANMAAAGRA